LMTSICSGPCDIIGDTSYEELRAQAYNDAKYGKSLQYIIERERSLINSKQAEFQNLAAKPQRFAAAAASSFQNPLAAINSTPPQITSKPFAPTVGGFGQISSAQNNFGNGSFPNYYIGQSDAPKIIQRSGNVFDNSGFNKSGAFGPQSIIQRPVQNTFAFGSANAGNVASSTSPFKANNSSDTQINFNFNQTSLTTGVEQQFSGITPSEENSNLDIEIWTKAEWKWNAGEIPEEPPPDICIH
ncbi:hypothetical protein M569_15151, partial [Genlisea aurea]